MIDETQIDKVLTLDIQYTYHPGISGISESGGDAVIPLEPAQVEIHTVTIHGAQLMYAKALWDELSERVLQEYC